MKSFRNKLKSKKDDSSSATQFHVDSAAPAVGGIDSASASVAEDAVPNETPEAAAARLVRRFCLTDASDGGAEVALLPSIVEAAESSPLAATECARYIRKFLYRENWSRPNFMYNAIMLMRILVENPGLTFTRNMDKKFVEAVRDVLRGCEQAHVVHFLIETMQELEAKGAVDEGLGRMIEMWQKEKAKSKSIYPPHAQQQPQQQSRSGFWQRPQPAWSQQQQQQQQQQMAMHHHHQQQQRAPTMSRAERRHGSSASLPKPRELRKRLDEAKTTAGVLADIVNTTPSSGLLDHDLADDLVSRCRRASGQVLDYLDTREPLPDNHEMAMLLSTHEILQQALHHYHGAVLEARKAINIGETRRAEDGSVPIEMTPAGKGKANAPQSPVAGEASGSNGHSHNNGRDSPRDRDDDDDDDFRRNEDDDMIAAAIAASVAPGANSRPGRGGYGQQYEGGGPANTNANDSNNPFADNTNAESSRSSSHVRPRYGGGSSSAAAASGVDAAGTGAVSYVNSDDDSDEEYLRSQRRAKAVAGPAYTGKQSSSSQKAPAGGPVELYAPPPGPPPPRPSAAGSSSQRVAELGGSSSAAAGASGSGSGSGSGPAVDAESGGQYPVYRY